ncbi:MAG: type II toxin-antitoxin system RelE/ParE family toxin [Phyllobacteriaceae bacterium]|nr:type II toxin-antitoxin system RelE/ParE family toxin [Phyllobacteriaceae bacterium]
MNRVSKRRLIVRPQAQTDIFDITDRIAADSLEAAHRLDMAFAERLNDLCATGAALRVRLEFGSDIRIAKFKSWLIFFRATPQSIIVFRVLHGAMHPKRIRAAAKSD